MVRSIINSLCLAIQWPDRAEKLGGSRLGAAGRDLEGLAMRWSDRAESLARGDYMPSRGMSWESEKSGFPQFIQEAALTMLRVVVGRCKGLAWGKLQICILWTVGRPRRGGQYDVRCCLEVWVSSAEENGRRAKVKDVVADI